VALGSLVQSEIAFTVPSERAERRGR